MALELHEFLVRFQGYVRLEAKDTYQLTLPLPNGPELPLRM